MTFFKRIKCSTIPFFKSRKNEKKHYHRFLDKASDQVAVWEKRDCPGGEVYFLGMLRECVCGQLRFQVPGMTEVEVTR
jgi:hypothetical protein